MVPCIGQMPEISQRPGVGSPFQIDFPQPANRLPAEEPIPNIDPLDKEPLSCSSSDPAIRCACLDCPDVCLALPYQPSPAELDACAPVLLLHVSPDRLLQPRAGLAASPASPSFSSSPMQSAWSHTWPLS